VWTTLATGFRPPEHGVTDFRLPGFHGEGLVLATSSHRRRAPLWRIASAQGRSVGFVGWWTTWPAEPVDGFVVSDHLAYNRWGVWADQARIEGDHLTFPPGLAGELRRFAVAPETVEEGTLTDLAPFNERERREMMAATKPVIFHAPSVLRFGYSTDASNVRFATHLLDTQGQPDLFALVMILGDVAGHVFWHHYEPNAFPRGDGDTHLAAAIPNVFVQLDRWTGEILERLDPDTYVVLLSDHGMGSKGLFPRPGSNGAGDHNPDGIIVVSGGGAPVGGDLGTLSSLDFAPTVLALLDLPAAEDMPGNAVEVVLPLDRRGVRPSIPTYGDGRSGIFPDLPSPGEKDYEERLRSLGYID